MVTFNGNVTINGDVEIFDNGSMKITSNRVAVHVSKLDHYIEQELSGSVNKKEYLEMAQCFQNSKDGAFSRRRSPVVSEWGASLEKVSWLMV